MSQIYCKYHPAVPARWACRQCQIDYCSQCTPKKDKYKEPHCPVCGGKLDSLGAGNVITPFWHRIPHFFIYPANLVPLLVMLGLVVIDMAVSGSIFGFLVQLAVLIVFVKYAYVVLEQSAQGYLQPKPFSTSDITEELELPFKQLLVIFIMYSANAFVLKNIGPGMFFITMLLTVFSFPASVMVLAVEHSFFSAFNPLVVLTSIKRIGLPYLILCIFLALLLSGSWFVMDLVHGVLPTSLVLPAVIFVSMYFTLIMFHMMGYVIYQYHEKLGYTIEQEFDEATNKNSATTRPAEKSTREFEILIQEGKQDEANKRMQQQIADNPNDMALWQQYHKFLYVTKDKGNLQKYGSRYISRLMHEGRPSRAMQVFCDIRQVIDNFKPDNATERFELARLLASNGQGRLAISLLNNLHSDFPSYADIPRAYQLVAKLLCEQFNDDARAKSVLEFVMKKYPSHPDIESIKDYYKVVDNLAARS
ncbi:MAG: hypothetical protein PVH16_05930 [Thioalkalispiraceae bacterium]|jgi:hypothetical protein